MNGSLISVTKNLVSAPESMQYLHVRPAFMKWHVDYVMAFAMVLPCLDGIRVSTSITLLLPDWCKDDLQGTYGPSQRGSHMFSCFSGKTILLTY